MFGERVSLVGKSDNPAELLLIGYRGEGQKTRPVINDDGQSHFASARFAYQLKKAGQKEV